MNSIDYLDLLMSNQKKVKDGFKFLNLKTKEQATIEDCYETIKKDLEILDFLIEKLYVASGLFELQVCPPNNPMIKNIIMLSKLTMNVLINTTKEFVN